MCVYVEKHEQCGHNEVMSDRRGDKHHGGYNRKMQIPQSRGIMEKQINIWRTKRRARYSVVGLTVKQ